MMLIEVTSVELAQAVRVLRNQCRKFMTRDTYEIAADKQVRWWYQLDHELCKVYLYGTLAPPVFSGYGILRRDGAKVWLSYGLAETARGHGLGAKLFGDLLKVAPAGAEIWAEVLNDNHAARGVLKLYGFETTSDDGRVTTLVRGVSR